MSFNRLFASLSPVFLATLLGLAGCNCDDEESVATPTTFKIEEDRNWFTGTSTHDWNSPGGVVRYTLDLDFNHGDVRVTIFDALGRIILDQLYKSVDWWWYVDGEYVDIEFTDPGQAGIWTVVLNYREYTGSLDLLLESLVEPPPDPIPPPSENSPLLDPGYGTGGRATYTLNTSWGKRLVVDSMERSIVAGTQVDATGRTLSVWRFLANGQLDPAFGSGGVFPLGSAAFSGGVDVVVDASDRILVAGWTASTERRTDLILLRVTTGGALDGSFGTGGIAVIDDAGGDEVGTAVAIDGAERVLVAGITGSLETEARTMLLARYTTAGVLDAGFGSGGIVRSSGSRDRATDLVVDGLDQPIVLGVRDQSLILWKFISSGSPDPSFGTGGIATSSGAANEFRAGFSLAFKGDDDTIVVTGARFFSTGTDPVEMAIWRLGIDGGPLGSFNGTGLLAYTFPMGAAIGSGVAFDGTGRILVAGRTRSTNVAETDMSATLWRYLDNGAIDTSLLGSNGTGVARFDERSGGIGTGASSLVVIGPDEALASGGVVDKATGVVNLLVWKLRP